MKKRTIKILVDGRMLAGTSVEILEQMQMLTFVMADQPLADYLEWFHNVMEQELGKKIPLPEGDEKETCTALVDAMVANGLAMEIFEGG